MTFSARRSTRSSMGIRSWSPRRPGTGKTIVAEFGVYEAFRRSGRVIYTTPIKALSNQKFRDLREIYGDEVGLLTGDVTENRDAPIVVMTTEVLRNMLLQTPWDLDDVDCVIFDEIHYLADPERGTTWEEAIILCPEHVQLDLPLGHRLQRRRDRRLDQPHPPPDPPDHPHRARRPAGALLLPRRQAAAWSIDHTGEQVARLPARRRRGRASGAARGGQAPRRTRTRRSWTSRSRARSSTRWPRRRCCRPSTSSSAATTARPSPSGCAVMRPQPGARRRRRAAASSRCSTAHIGCAAAGGPRAGAGQGRSPRWRAQGIGFHHAGLLPILKQLVEVLFTRGLMQVVFATDTLALGVNMPARSVVIGRHEQVGRPPAPRADPERVPADGRAGRAARHGRLRARRRALLALDHLPRDAATSPPAPLEPVRSAPSRSATTRCSTSGTRRTASACARCCSRAWRSSRPASASASWKTTSSRSAATSPAMPQGLPDRPRRRRRAAGRLPAASSTLDRRAARQGAHRLEASWHDLALRDRRAALAGAGPAGAAPRLPRRRRDWSSTPRTRLGGLPRAGRARRRRPLPVRRRDRGCLAEYRADRLPAAGKLLSSCPRRCRAARRAGRAT